VNKVNVYLNFPGNTEGVFSFCLPVGSDVLMASDALELLGKTVVQGLLSWFAIRPGHILHRVRAVLTWLTEPYLRLFRRLIPTPHMGVVGIDLSALVGLIALFVVAQVVVRL
jgi:uncharacterized protein YggT (Ycf19 family)